jgi:hypothetical protein
VVPNAPEPELRLDREGQFFFGGAPCLKTEITDLFFEKLEPDGVGGYRLSLGPERAAVLVEEAPLRVRNVLSRPGADGKTPQLVLCLDGGLVEPFDPGTLRFQGDVPWCRARGMDARFTPTAALALGELHFRHGAQDPSPAT